ncbi:M14 family metallopeptidase [Abyssalbus ytuae]|uniref:M14 family metallopeptidase n=1 Tax=Abyssalbus ytuae TaxID=2926907 RepID=A0A9E7D387_9FLAO|nr:M14 metallopeptidase family protein [Abyssalbus ytuae]UOB17574.1 M14 family metallopeptidase [Abyssalbus ytuae]
MEIHTLINWYKTNVEKKVSGRYLNFSSIVDLINLYSGEYNVQIIGHSVNNQPIHKIVLGNGPKKILMWSQMHGNESTTTKAVFDLLKFLSIKSDFSKNILSDSTICIVPMLNPDGATAYTRVNANNIDLNRDAQNLSQPESKILRKLFNEFGPDFCFNLHDQRTIFSAGKNKKPATVSFLSPAQDKDRSVTLNRKKSMEIISVMNDMLQLLIPGQVGRYDDGFNINCVGDTFQSLGVPTILFESGHYHNDYSREKTREYVFYSLVKSITYICKNEIRGENFENYFNIPENEKLFYDIIYRNFPLIINGEEKKSDIGILFKEILQNCKVNFIPFIENCGNLEDFFGHKEFSGNDIDYFPTDINTFKTHYLAKI